MPCPSSENIGHEHPQRQRAAFVPTLLYHPFRQKSSRFHIKNVTCSSHPRHGAGEGAGTIIIHAIRQTTPLTPATLFFLIDIRAPRLPNNQWNSLDEFTEARECEPPAKRQIFRSQGKGQSLGYMGFSVSLFPLITLLSRLAVTIKCRVQHVYRGAPAPPAKRQICFGLGQGTVAAPSFIHFALAPRGYHKCACEARLPRRASAPSEAANIIILCPGQGKDTFSSSSHQLCLTRLAVTIKCRVQHVYRGAPAPPAKRQTL